MLITNNISLQFGKRVLFDEVNVKFTHGNCYGVIGANGAGKSTFLKILAGDIDPTIGRVEITPGERMSVLRQNHFEFNDFTALDTVIMGNTVLYKIMKEKDAIYMKEDFTEADGLRAAELEGDFAEMNGWDAESDAATMLSNLGVKEDLHHKLVGELNGSEKVRVLLAQALFGNPDILLLDEPTNDLDAETILWLEDFLADFKNTVIVVSHDRHFLDMVCTHITDIDFCKVNMYSGNYTFWYETSQLALKQRADKNKKAEDKRKELLDFIARFSANASKSKQATSRKKALEKINIDDIKPSSRRYPFIHFKPEREPGNEILEVKDLSYTMEDGTVLFDKVSFSINRNEKIALYSRDALAMSYFFKVLAGEVKPTRGEVNWGVTITPAYLPNDNTEYFQGDNDQNLVDWLRQYSKEGEKDEQFIRGFLGRMLFSGEEVMKKSSVLSGGEKVRCMLSRMMLKNPNFLLLDEPTNHLDLESITTFNNGLIEFPGNVIFTSHDQQFMQTVANRIVEITPKGNLDKLMSFDEYITSKEVRAQRDVMYA
jgi:ATPase subunit of ABC transporter with duplicated ATPase domains